MKILHLVLFSDDKYYNEMYKITSKYYSEFNDNIKTIYYKFNNSISEEYKLENDILNIKGNETRIPGILVKTIKSFIYFQNELVNYDYIIRSNISTVIDFKNLIILLEKDNYDYGGYLWEGKEFPCPFVSGTCIILNRLIVENMLTNTAKILFNIIDDVAIGLYLNKIIKKYKFLNLNNYYYWVNSVKKENLEVKLNEKKLINKIIFRNKSANRKDDIDRIKNIISYLKKIDK